MAMLFNLWWLVALHLCTVSALFFSPPQQLISTPSPGFSFTPGGLLFPYHIGVAKALQDEGILTEHSHVSGASAGALVTAVIGCGIDFCDVADATKDLVKKCRDEGTIWKLKSALEQVLEEMLPEDAHAIIERRPGSVGIAITALKPLPQGEVIRSFDSKEDLMEVLLGSCNFSFWFHSSGLPTVDGFWASPLDQFGCPEIPLAERTVRVSCFPSAVTKMASSEAWDIISPDLLAPSKLMPVNELVQLALSPGNGDQLEALYSTGYESGQVWLERHAEEFTSTKPKMDLLQDSAVATATAAGGLTGDSKQLKLRTQALECAVAIVSQIRRWEAWWSDDQSR